MILSAKSLFASRSNQSTKFCLSQNLLGNNPFPVAVHDSIRWSVYHCKQLLRTHLAQHRQRVLKANFRFRTLGSIGASAFVLGTGLTHVDPKRLFPVALCSSNHNSRLAHFDENSEEDIPNFQWRMLFELLWQDILFLVGAVMVSLICIIFKYQRT